MSGARWIPDHTASRCFECNTPFTFLTRKHHCRMCGRIFCYKCTENRRSVPIEWQAVKTPPTSYLSWFSNRQDENYMVVGSPNKIEYHQMHQQYDGSEKRICNDCTKIVEVTLDHDDMIQILLLLGSYSVGPKEWEQLWYVNKAWREVTTLMFYQWDSIRHIMPYQKATIAQRKMLKCFKTFFSPTHLWWNTLLARENIPMPHYFEEISCIDMNCRIFCHLFPPAFKALVSLILGDRKIAVKLFRELKDFKTVRQCMINILASATLADPYLVADLLVPILSNQEDLAIMMYFAINARDKGTADTLYRHLPQETQHHIDRGTQWIQTMIAVANAPEKDRYKFSSFVGPVRLPMRPSIEVLKILDTSIVTKKSSSNPRVIPCQCRMKGQSHVFVKCFMIKTEDVRQDAMVQDFMKMLRICCHHLEHVNYECVTYDVLPLTKSSGLVTLIPGARTLYSLLIDNTSLQNWTLENNTNFSVDHIKGRFVRSCAFATTVSMILSVGDRHLENMLMTRQGLLFHVDYAMLLGREPNHMKSMIGNTCRITPQMLDFLGGTTSAYYKTFQKSCGHIYTTARECFVPLYACMVSLVYDEYCTREFLETVLEQIFCPEAQSSEARIKIEDRVDRESGRVTWSDTVTDAFHHLFQKWT